MLIIVILLMVRNTTGELLYLLMNNFYWLDLMLEIFLQDYPEVIIILMKKNRFFILKIFKSKNNIEVFFTYKNYILPKYKIWIYLRLYLNKLVF